ncbi:Hypothetical predicted protein [Lecanosticta acicola]|uniref:Uncharacterized protein n=1 Tax=Lecanosticta acicola TaxID=111012 RepID=A0AAI8Z5S1_9PEZI|nr:Hypothetical predicted protein [Lecanosticta acicola]
MDNLSSPPCHQLTSCPELNFTLVERVERFVRSAPRCDREEVDTQVQFTGLKKSYVGLVLEAARELVTAAHQEPEDGTYPHSQPKAHRSESGSDLAFEKACHQPDQRPAGDIIMEKRSPHPAVEHQGPRDYRLLNEAFQNSDVTDALRNSGMVPQSSPGLGDGANSPLRQQTIDGNGLPASGLQQRLLVDGLRSLSLRPMDTTNTTSKASANQHGASSSAQMLPHYTSAASSMAAAAASDDALHSPSLPSPLPSDYGLPTAEQLAEQRLLLTRSSLDGVDKESVRFWPIEPHHSSPNDWNPEIAEKACSEERPLNSAAEAKPADQGCRHFPANNTMGFSAADDAQSGQHAPSLGDCNSKDDSNFQDEEAQTIAHRLRELDQQIDEGEENLKVWRKFVTEIAEALAGMEAEMQAHVRS